MTSSGTTLTGPEVLVELDRSAGRSLRAQLEDGLREAIRNGRLPAGGRMPATRTLAADLGLSRRLVVDAYSQLLAEGYLVARRGAGTFVAAAAAAATPPAPGPRAPRLSFDFFPGNPDLSTFPRAAFLRAMRDTMRTMPDSALGYPDPRGAGDLRRALAEHLRRVRGVAADPRAVVVCAGVAQGFALLAAALGEVRLAVEDPGLPPHRAILASRGAELVALPVDEHGARVEELTAPEGGPIDAALVTPAHQSPTGVALGSRRRAALLAWAKDGGGLILEDDYDAEFRYDRLPLGALQGLAPDRVVYLGTVSKSLAPGLRLGWLVLPPDLVEPVVQAKMLADQGCSVVDQLALAEMLRSGAYDRHLRAARRRYRGRRDALLRAVQTHIDGARVTGVAAGLHATVRLPFPVDGAELMAAAARQSVGVYPLGLAYLEPRRLDDGLILGYANLAEPAIEEGIRRLALALEELPPGPAPT